MKHKHADLIHAWADGAEIQRKSLAKNDETWFDEDEPRWFEEAEYRIKPEEKKPVVRWLWAIKVGADGRTLLSTEFTEEQPDDGYGWVKLEWSRQEFPE
jgi:hypothetical protein